MTCHTAMKWFVCLTALLLGIIGQGCEKSTGGDALESGSGEDNNSGTTPNTGDDAGDEGAGGREVAGGGNDGGNIEGGEVDESDNETPTDAEPVIRTIAKCGKEQPNTKLTGPMKYVPFNNSTCASSESCFQKCTVYNDTTTTCSGAQWHESMSTDEVINEASLAYQLGSYCALCTPADGSDDSCVAVADGDDGQYGEYTSQLECGCGSYLLGKAYNQTAAGEYDDSVAVVMEESVDMSQEDCQAKCDEENCENMEWTKPQETTTSSTTQAPAYPISTQAPPPAPKGNCVTRNFTVDAAHMADVDDTLLWNRCEKAVPEEQLHEAGDGYGSRNAESKEGGSMGFIIGGALAAVFVVALIAVGCVVYKKKKGKSAEDPAASARGVPGGLKQSTRRTPAE